MEAGKGKERRLQVATGEVDALAANRQLCLERLSRSQHSQAYRTPDLSALDILDAT